MAFIPKYIFILFITITVDYVAGIYIERSEGRKRKAWLIISILSTVLVLATFKYFDFFNANIAAIAAVLHWNYSISVLSLVLPIGLSFHTFQGLSYVIEVYRGKQKAEYHFGIYALYVMFYPQLVAGPIERPQNLLHQFYEKHKFQYEQVVSGLQKMLWGMFKKVVIADNLAVFVNLVYNDPHGFSGLPLIIATIFFAFQIYCDFSGYSDIAIGAAQVMGFRLSKNFDNPYFSGSISDFWKRWHISLSSWFRDYVYIPLGGNRATTGRIYFNLLVTFILSGLWHGANWTYIIWGAVNGIYLITEITTKNVRNRIATAIGLDQFPKTRMALSIATTFFLICFAWIFFRANTVYDAWYVISHLFISGAVFSNTIITVRSFLFLSALILFLILVELIQIKPENFINRIRQHSTVLRWGTYYIAIALIVYFLNGSTPSQFIYFQF
ncbi:MAG: MBOAT family O-acyltransferase [Candidatus Uhrbacteria bacterium]|nr:MBOAT family O-acyltransferase [Candidatus Uhrbacteria bacterium]